MRRRRLEEEMPGPLEGIKVLDISHVVAGPFCTLLLANAGAQVIKVEPPEKGEYGRSIGPFVTDENGRTAAGCFIRMNRNKKSVTLNLKEPEGRELFLQLAEQSDVVVENFRPGVMKRLGLDYQTLSERNPRIVMASISGYGQPAEGNVYWHRPAYNMVMQAMAGIAEVTGYEDRRPAEVGLPIGDIIPGTMTALAIVQALFHREKTGKGQYIDVSMYDALSLVSERSMLNYQLTGELPRRGEERHIAPHSSYLAKDGYFVVDCYSNREWNTLCKVIGRTDLVDHEDFDSGSKRAERAETYIRPMIEDWAADKTKKEAADLLADSGVGAAPVQNVRDMMDCPHLAHREMLVKVQDPVAGELVYPGDPIRHSESGHPSFEPAPLLGEDNYLLQEMLDLSDEQMEELKREGAI